MEIDVKQSHLAKALRVVVRLANNKSSLAILSNILLKADSGEITITGTDLEVAASCKVPGKITKEGSTTVPAKLFHDLVTNIDTENISLKTEDGKISVSTEKLNSVINTVAAEEFPVIPKTTENNTTIPADILRNGVQNVINSTSKDDTRPILGGVHVYTSEGGIVFVSTDSYRLSEYKAEYSGSDNFTVTIPIQAAQEILLMLDGENSAQLGFKDGQVELETDEVALVSKTIEGSYPDYKNLIPKESETTLSTSKQELVNAVKTAGLFAKDVGGSIQFSVDSSGFSVGSTGTLLGDNTTTVEAIVGGEGSVSINSRYIIDALNTFETDSIDIGFASNISPITITSKDEPNNTQLIMPLKT